MFRFKNWRIYQEARLLRLEVHRTIFPKLPVQENFALHAQIRRAADSIILNIAEGSYRKTDKDLARFLNQALGSLYEVVSALDLLLDSEYIDREEHTGFTVKFEKLA